MKLIAHHLNETRYWADQARMAAEHTGDPITVLVNISSAEIALQKAKTLALELKNK